MVKKVFNMAGGLHSAAAYSALENRAYGSCAASLDSFACTAGAGMKINIAAGDGLISTQENFARRIQSDATESVTVAAASPSYSRIDAVVAYIDNAVTPTTSVIDNTNNILNFACVAGTAASSPAAPTSAAIQQAIGAGNDYVVLYEVTVPSGATSMNNATFTRKIRTLSVLDLAMIPDGLITGQKIAQNTVKSDNIDWATLRADMAKEVVAVTGIKFYVNNAEQAGGLNAASKITTEINAAKNLFRVYGFLIAAQATTTQVGEYRFNTDMRPRTEISVTGAGIRVNKTSDYVVTTVSNVDLKISTSGVVTISSVVRQANEDLWIWLPPTLYSA